MQLPLQVTFRNLPPSEAIEAAVRERAARLNVFFDRIMACRVVIEAPHRHHRRGNLFHVRIDLTVPGEELVVSREPAAHQAYQDVYVAIRDAFDEARRQLEDYVRRHRDWKKPRVGPPHGRISRLFPEEGYGFLETADGRQVYFHRNSVRGGDFDRLSLGTEVRFSEEEGEKGPQASTVEMVGKAGKHDLFPLRGR
jgi:ribosomal subunit interface protein